MDNMGKDNMAGENLAVIKCWPKGPLTKEVENTHSKEVINGPFEHAPDQHFSWATQQTFQFHCHYTPAILATQVTPWCFLPFHGECTWTGLH